MSKLTGKASALYRQNSTSARRLWTFTECPELLQILRELTITFGFSVRPGELILLDGKWYVTHPGLLGLARRNGCRGIRVQLLGEFYDPAASRWVFKRIVYKTRRSKGFVGYGDADLSNVPRLADSTLQESGNSSTGCAAQTARIDSPVASRVLYFSPVSNQSMLTPNPSLIRKRTSAGGAINPLSYLESCPWLTPMRRANSSWFISNPRTSRMRRPISRELTRCSRIAPFFLMTIMRDSIKYALGN
jgi:hypothetical protein